MVNETNVDRDKNKLNKMIGLVTSWCIEYKTHPRTF